MLTSNVGLASKRGCISSTKRIGAIVSIQQGKTSTWVKSSYSAGNGACVEVASPVVDEIAVRDSKDPHGPTLSFAPASWSAFVADVHGGAFDLG
jgi:hypothetical protein